MPKINKVVTTVWYNKEDMRALRHVFKDAKFSYVYFYDKEKLAEEVKDSDVAIIIGDVDPCLLGENSLKWIHCDHAGLNGSARPEVFARGIPVTGSAGRSAPVLAEHAIYFMFQSCYHTKELLNAQSKHQWGVEGSQSFKGLYGRTAGIIGLGNNGKLLATRLKALGMKVIGYDKFPIKDTEIVDELYVGNNGDNINPLIEKSDFVILTCALTDETFHLINKDTIALMKDGVVIVNIARGGVICTEDLIEALKSKKVACAGLDVFEEQPLSADSPLWDMDNVYITPHMTPQVPHRNQRSIEIIKENARRFENDEPLLNLMRKEDAVSGEKAEGGWSRMMNSNLSKEEIEKMPLDKFLGKRGWSDPSEWLD